MRFVYYCLAVFVLAGCGRSPRTENNFFNKKDLSGWSAANMQYWTVEDSAIVGKAAAEVDRNQFIWSDIKVKNFYLSVDVRLDSADRNAGIQFRSQKINDYGQAMGYQADMGVNYGINIWGTLYYEDGRGLLHTSDPAKTPVKNDDWNHYEILAVDDRIWIAVNGKIISAVQDKGGDEEGYIALQIHSGPAQTVRYKINELVHDPVVALAGNNEEALNAALHAPLVPVPGHNTFKLKSGDIVAFTGGTNTVNMSNDGYLETLLSSYFKDADIKFRNLGWEGDNVYEQFRDVGFGDWFTNLDSVKATTVFVQFGQMEALDSLEKLPAFIDAYKKILDTLKAKNRQVVMLSPNAMEPENINAKKYFNAIQLLAQTEGYSFVDLYYPLMDDRRLTYDGVHLNDEGQKVAAEITMKSLGIGTPFNPEMEPLRKQVITKNTLWYEYWRPGNWAFLRGDRQEPAFSRHWKDYSKRIFPEEIARYAPLIAAEEKKIRDIAGGKKIAPAVIAQDTIARIPVDDNTIAEELASFNLDNNYNIELFASESLGIAEPCAMRWDEKGRLWVLCIPAYPQPLPGQPANDKLIVLEDRDKDGRADASTVFAENLDIPLGFELGHNGVYLGEQTKLLFLKDTNNDLRCDTREVLFSGFGTHDSHQTINSFTWSPGGELFFAHGLSIHSYVETSRGLKKAHRASIWRYRPGVGQLDNIIDQNGASENPWGITFGNWGEMFSKSNDTGVYFTSPALVLSDHKSFVPEIGGTHIKSGIVEIPRSSHLPEDIRNDFLIAGYYNNKVERIKLIESGAGYKGRLVEPLLSSTGKNFRPVDIKTGPDGAIYVLDWYNPIIGHYQASLRDPQRDKTHGRIWRITAKSRPLLKQPVLDKQTLPVLFNNLSSDEYWVRYQSRRLVFSKPAGEVLPALSSWVSGISGTDDKRLMSALTVYENFETVNEDLLKRLLKAENTGARAYALQVAARWSDRIAQPLALIKPLVHDVHPRVRLMAIVACGHVRSPESMNIVAGVLQYPMDKFTHFAFERTVFALRDAWEPAFRKGTVKFASNTQLATVISILTPEWYTADMYRTLLGSGSYDANVKSTLLSALCNVGSNSDVEYVLAQPFTQGNVLLLNEIGQKEIKQVSAGTAASIRKILLGSNEDLRVSAIKLVRSWNIGELADVVRDLVMKTGASSNVIAQGITSLVSVKDKNVTPLLDRFIGHSSKQVRMACINGYAKLDVKRGAAETLKEMNRGNGDVNEMRESLVSIIYEPGGIQAVTDEINRSGLKSNLVSAALIAFDQKHIDDKNLIAAIKKYEKADTYAIPADYDEKFVSALATKVKAGGVAANGEKIYNKLTCAACHTLNNKGGNIGPNLSAIGSGLSVDDIITEVLWPNKNIKEGYGSVRLDLKNGESVQGIKGLETGAAISVKATPGSTPISYNKKDLATITAIGSAMPAGLMSTVSEDELRDVIKYLSEQRDR